MEKRRLKTPDPATGPAKNRRRKKTGNEIKIDHVNKPVTLEHEI